MSLVLVHQPTGVALTPLHKQKNESDEEFRGRLEEYREKYFPGISGFVIEERARTATRPIYRLFVKYPDEDEERMIDHRFYSEEKAKKAAEKIYGKIPGITWEVRQ